MNCNYPNLAELIQYHPYHICTFANHANVTLEVFTAVLEDGEELTADEALGISSLVDIPLNILFSKSLVMLVPEDSGKVEELQRAAQALHGCAAVDKLVADYAKGRATFCQFAAAKERVEFAKLKGQTKVIRTTRITK